MTTAAPPMPEMPASPIAGVVPAELREVTVMVVWPSVSASRFGQLLGRLFGIRSGIGNIATLGNLLALMTIPLAMPLYFSSKYRRYRLTNRRVIIEAGPYGKPQRSVSLADFDAIDVAVLPGQEWYHAGELIFRRGNVETLRLSGVPRPETFRRTCLKSQRSYVAVRKAIA